MSNWKGIVGSSFDPDEFEAYCHKLQWTSWRPSFIVIHNTAIPTLAQRLKGFTQVQIKTLEKYYRDEKKWSAGPHLFVDDNKIWVFTPLTLSGTHSPSWNKLAFGVEMLGDYEKESFNTWRGQKVRTNTVAALATLNAVLGLDPEKMRLHKEDPGTTHNCPGKNVRKLEIIQDVIDLIGERHAGDHALA